MSYALFDIKLMLFLQLHTGDPQVTMIQPTIFQIYGGAKMICIQ